MVCARLAENVYTVFPPPIVEIQKIPFVKLRTCFKRQSNKGGGGQCGDFGNG